MPKALLLLTFVFFSIALSSCDAVVHLFYSIENNTSESVRVFVPNYSSDHFSLYKNSAPKDTILTLVPGEKFIVDGASKIDFPWGAKNIYRDHPGKCGLKIVEQDTLIELGCSEAEWKYRRRTSNLELN